jgi:hypothetical protein
LRLLGLAPTRREIYLSLVIYGAGALALVEVGGNRATDGQLVQVHSIHFALLLFGLRFFVRYQFIHLNNP